MRIYVAGPMTGLPEFNYPAFHEAAAQLRALGYEVENPAENQGDAETTWQDWMRLGLAQVLRCEGVALLDGWHTSKGAMLEAQVAEALEMTVVPLKAWLTRRAA